MVQVDKDVWVAECDGCGKTVDLDESRFDYGKPEDWFSLVCQAEFTIKTFCSKPCVAQWAAGEVPTSAELTQIAREAFAQASGAQH